MRRFAFFVVLTAGLISLSYAHQRHSSFGSSFGVFYSSLDPYGEWISVDNDLYAWRPANVNELWRPYTVGRWAWTDDGWYWVSGEPWGWATYHYGRWYHDDFYGWLWIPGHEWSPAWVEWRYGGDCIGWAPLGPYALFNISFGIHYSTHWVTPGFWWSFVDCSYIGGPSVHRYVYRTEDNTRYIGRTRSAGSVRSEGGRIVTRGPERDYVERRGKVRIERADVVDIRDHQERVVRGERHDRIEVYRPKIEERERGAEIERPTNVRESSRRVGLDVNEIAVRSRDREREAGRDLGKAEEYRKTVRPDETRQVEPRRENDRSEQSESKDDRSKDVRDYRTEKQRKVPQGIEQKTKREKERSPNSGRPVPRPGPHQRDNAGEEKGGGRRR